MLHDFLKLVWECRTDAKKLFFPPADLRSPAPAMLSCATLDAAVIDLPKVNPGAGVPSESASASQKRGGGGGVVDVAEERSSALADCGGVGSTKEQDTSARGEREEARCLRETVDPIGKRPPREERDGDEGEAAAGKGVVTADGERHAQRRRRRRRHRGEENGGVSVGGVSVGGGCDGGRDGKAITGIGLSRPYVIDLKEEVSKQEIEGRVSGSCAEGGGYVIIAEKPSYCCMPGPTSEAPNAPRLSPFPCQRS